MRYKKAQSEEYTHVCVFFFHLSVLVFVFRLALHKIYFICLWHEMAYLCWNCGLTPTNEPTNLWPFFRLRG